jgi:hypothetical protein
VANPKKKEGTQQQKTKEPLVAVKTAPVHVDKARETAKEVPGKAARPAKAKVHFADIESEESDSSLSWHTKEHQTPPKPQDDPAQEQGPKPWTPLVPFLDLLVPYMRNDVGAVENVVNSLKRKAGVVENDPRAQEDEVMVVPAPKRLKGKDGPAIPKPPPLNVGTEPIRDGPSKAPAVTEPAAKANKTKRNRAISPTPLPQPEPERDISKSPSPAPRNFSKLLKDKVYLHPSQADRTYVKLMAQQLREAKKVERDAKKIERPKNVEQYDLITAVEAGVRAEAVDKDEAGALEDAIMQDVS